MKKNFLKTRLLAFSVIFLLLLSAACASASSINDVLQTLSTDSVNDQAANNSSNASTGTAAQTNSALKAMIMPGLESANVRSSAWGEIIGTILPGNFIDIKGEEGDWYIIEFEGKKGYILKQALTTNTNIKPNSKTTSISGTVKVSRGNRLNVRNGVWGDKIGSLNPGDKIQIFGEDGEWYKIYYNGKTGYVYKKYVIASDEEQAVSANGENPAVPNTPAAPAPAAPAQPSDPSQPAAASDNQLINWLQQAGFRGDGLHVAWAIAMRESNGIPNIGKGTKYFNGCDWGLFQLNKPTFGKKAWWDDQKIMDPIYCAKVVFDLSKGGTYWLPWGISGDGKSMNAACYKMWSAEKQRKCIWEPFKKWYDKYPLK